MNSSMQILILYLKFLIVVWIDDLNRRAVRSNYVQRGLSNEIIY
jgi:hypothetical protein